MNILKELREQRGRNPKDLARAAGIDVAAYFDLETQDDELTCAVAIGVVSSIARELGVTTSSLYGGTSSRSVTPEQLAAMLRDHLAKSDLSLSDFEAAVGWSLRAALNDPDHFRTFTADGIRDVCSAVGVNWFDALDGI
jgi:transcriptional regulator with XRE-family HTH domain